jgi:hypothetical protein
MNNPNQTASTTGTNQMPRDIREYLEETPNRNEKLYSPSWNARGELAKNIVFLASGSILLTIFFSHSFVNTRTNASQKYFLLSSWISFLISIGFGLLCQWSLTKLQSGAVRFERCIRNIEMFEHMASINLGDKDEIASKISSQHNAFLELNSSIEEQDSLTHGFLNICMVTFILGLILLGLLGWQQVAA